MRIKGIKKPITKKNPTPNKVSFSIKSIKIMIYPIKQRRNINTSFIYLS